MNKIFYILFSIFFIVFFLGLSFLTPGGFLVLDFVITPFSQYQPWYSTTIQWHLVNIVNFILGYEITSKLYYLFVFIFGLFVSFKIGGSIHKLSLKPLSLFITQSITATFFLCNPWVYERLITQPSIALGMMFISLGVHYLLENILSPTKNGLSWAAASFGIAFMIFPHASLLTALILLIYAGVFLKKIPLKYYLLGPLFIILPNINWIIGDIFYAENLGITATKDFDWANIQGFTGNSLSGLGVDITHLLLYGFWGERYHIVTPNMLNEYWYILGFIVLAIIILGNICLYKSYKKIWLFLTSFSIIGFILAVGISSEIFGIVNSFLYLHFDIYAGMREPQKWLGITMIGYCVFFIVGVSFIKEKLQWLDVRVYFLIIFVLVNTWSPMNTFGFHGQLYGKTIPLEYGHLSSKIYQNEPNGKYLVLPWHTYMECSWTHGKTIASVQEKIFHPLNVVVSDNLELDTKYTNSNSLQSKEIESYLRSKDTNILIENNITHIIYQKHCADIKRYEYLSEDRSLESVIDNDAVSLYKIKNEK